MQQARSHVRLAEGRGRDPFICLMKFPLFQKNIQQAKFISCHPKLHDN
jgi:hypothetical protein